jgi:3-hydroxybutyryl-CoA dehydrogenase
MKVYVIGTGTMGAGVVQAFAQANMPVVMKSRTQASLDKAVGKISKSLAKLVEKGKVTQEYMDSVMANISTTVDYADFADADLVIEAASEDMNLKKEVFAELAKVCKPETIFATNTSSLSITEIAAITDRPSQFIGMHFFNPAPVMKLVEVIKGQMTSEETSNKIFELATAIGKTPVMVEEAPGFVVNRILVPMINEAVGIYAEGIASVEDIDSAMKLGANHPMGPLALGDLIGLDVCLAIMEVLYNEFADSKYRPHPLLKKMVRAGLLGRKSGQGFYKY